MINCIAIDDEPLALDLISGYCARIDYLNLKKTFTKTSEAGIYLKRFPIDLLFLDIQMPDINGIDFYKSLKIEKPVIFTTAYSEYAVEGFNLNALDYLLKPIVFSRFEQAVKKTKSYLDYLKYPDHEKDRFLYVRSDYRLCRISIPDIRYIEGLNNYIIIYTSISRPVISHISLKEVSGRLPGNMFLRIHRSYIVNTAIDVSYSNRVVYLGDKKIPVGVSYEQKVKAFFGLRNNRAT